MLRTRAEWNKGERYVTGWYELGREDRDADMLREAVEVGRAAVYVAGGAHPARATFRYNLAVTLHSVARATE